MKVSPSFAGQMLTPELIKVAVGSKQKISPKRAVRSGNRPSLKEISFSKYQFPGLLVSGRVRIWHNIYLFGWSYKKFSFRSLHFGRRCWFQAFGPWILPFLVEINEVDEDFAVVSSYSKKPLPWFIDWSTWDWGFLPSLELTLRNARENRLCIQFLGRIVSHDFAGVIC